VAEGRSYRSALRHSDAVDGQLQPPPQESDRHDGGSDDQRSGGDSSQHAAAPSHRRHQRQLVAPLRPLRGRRGLRPEWRVQTRVVLPCSTVIECHPQRFRDMQRSRMRCDGSTALPQASASAAPAAARQRGPATRPAPRCASPRRAAPPATATTSPGWRRTAAAGVAAASTPQAPGSGCCG
jgi:hypothetical protein